VTTGAPGAQDAAADARARQISYLESGAAALDNRVIDARDALGLGDNQAVIAICLIGILEGARRLINALADDWATS
jgi:hypothetical protein